MAGTKITDFPTATVPLTGTEIFPVVQGGVTKQTTINQTTANSARILANIAALQALNVATTSLPVQVQLTNNYVAGDGGGVFRYDSTDTTTADNGGTVVVDALGRRWKRQYSGAVDVRWFGAKGDGATNDTTAIQNAITAAAINGSLYFPYGTYLISDSIQPLNGQTLAFEKGSSLKFAAGVSNKDVIRIASTSDDVTITDVFVDGNAANTTNCGGITVYGDRCILVRPKVRDVDNYGIYSADTEDMVVHEPNIGGTIGNIAIFLTTVSAAAQRRGPIVRGGVVDRSAMGTSLTFGGVFVRGSASYPLKGALVEGVHIVLPKAVLASDKPCIECIYVDQIRVSENYTEGGSRGVSLGHCPGAVIADNTVLAYKYDGIELSDSCNNSSVSGNTIDASGQTSTSGVAAQGASGTNDDVTIDANTIIGCDTRGVYGFASKRLAVTNNTIRMVGGDAIYIQEQEGWVIDGNTIYGGDTPTGVNGVVVTGSTGEGSVGDNLIQNFTTNGILFVGTTAITINDVSVTGNTLEGNGAALTTTLSGGAVIGANFKVLGNAGITDYLDFANLVPLYASSTFTPTVTCATPGDLSVAYTTQSATYQRIGKWVQVEINLNFTPTYTTATGAVRIAGLPFAAVSSATPSSFVLNDITAFTWPASRTQLVPVANSGQSYITIQGLGSAASPVDLAITDKASGSGAIIRLRGSYRIMT